MPPRVRYLLHFSFCCCKIICCAGHLLSAVSLNLPSDRIEFPESAVRFQKAFCAQDQPRLINGVAVPSDFPAIDPTILEEGIAPGRLFLTSRYGPDYIMIFENDGTPYFYQRVPGESHDFKLQPTGLLTRFDVISGRGFIGMDSSYREVSSFRCTNGYATNEHEMIMSPNGHYFLIATGYHFEDMSRYVEGGLAHATLIDNHIQEFDKDGNLVFQWLCTDFFSVSDAVYENLTQPNIDYVHINSLAVDYDGHIIISSRNLSEVTKINRQTGDIIWRFGGNNNQFQLANEDDVFSYQHSVLPVDGEKDHYLLFDNGNYSPLGLSRAIEYELNIETKTAHKVWEFRHPSGHFSPYMGSVQRLLNGNTLINWSGGEMPVATEVTPDGRIVYEAFFKGGYSCYRTFRIEWESKALKPVLFAESFPDMITLIFNKFGDKNIKEYLVYGGKSPEHLSVMCSTPLTYQNFTTLENFSTYYFKVCAVDKSGTQSEFSETVSAMVHYYKDGENLIRNGDFQSRTDDWILRIEEGANATGEILDHGIYYINIQQPGNWDESIQLLQDHIPLISGRKYTLEFDAWADEARSIQAKLSATEALLQDYAHMGLTNLKPVKRHFSCEFEMSQTVLEARLVFNCGISDINVYLDNISLVEKSDVLVDDIPEQPVGYNLQQNFPNPFNGKTRIVFSVPAASWVTVQIYNVIGELVHEIVKQTNTAGAFSLWFDAAKLPSGIYYYKMESRSLNSISGNVYRQTKKMLILK
ncbi:aryl-sulfate sulfotransferase [candidate division KSB1 bacterium]|nr:aryl-sulfate sulfotransferase [candidate division KSB1 bacterium]